MEWGWRDEPSSGIGRKVVEFDVFFKIHFFRALVSIDDVDSRTNGGLKRTGPNATSIPSSWKRCKQEETAKQGASNSVLMNLLVSGCDVSAGYVCFTSPKSKNAHAAGAAASQQRICANRFYEQQTPRRHNLAAK